MVRALLLAYLVSLAMSACSASDPAGLLATPPPATIRPAATGLATEPVATKMRSPRPTSSGSKSGSFYKPPGWDGVSDVDCPDFDTHAQAQSFFKGTGGTKSNDPYRLDNDHDGLACETLP
jgi:hypothetical protein